MARIVRCLAIALWGLTSAPLPLTAQPAPDATDVVSSRDRFSGHITFEERRTPPGPAPLVARPRVMTPTIHYQVLSLAPGLRAAAPPAPQPDIRAVPLKAQGGYVIYELRAGKLTTVINGNRQERGLGEFWLVRPGETITLETHDDSVVVQTIQIPNL